MTRCSMALLVLTAFASGLEAAAQGRSVRGPIDVVAPVLPTREPVSPAAATAALERAAKAFERPGPNSLEFAQALQVASVLFPSVAVSTNLGHAQFQTVALSDGGREVTGVRFMVPSLNFPNLYLAFSLPAKGMTWWNVVPAAGTNLIRRNWKEHAEVPASNFVEQVGAEPSDVIAIRFMDNSHTAWPEGLQAGMEYVLWFRLSDRAPFRTTLALTFLSEETRKAYEQLKPDGLDPKEALALGLHLRRSPNDQLERAAELGDLTAIDAALEAGADIRAVAVLYWAAYRADLNTVEHLCALGADPRQVYTDSRDSALQTLCARSASPPRLPEADLLRAVAVLIAHGADPNQTNTWGKAALHKAAENGAVTNILACLLRAGADPGLRDEEGETPADIAVRNGHRAAFVAALQQAGKRFPMPPPNVDELISVIRLNLPAEVDAILNQDRALANAHARYGFTPLMRAADGGHADWARYLLEHGADANARDDFGATALHHAAETPNPAAPVIQVLVDRGANLNAVDAKGRTPLVVARQDGAIKLAAFLESLGAHE